MTEKENAIREVILKRIDVLEKVIDQNKNLSPMEKSYYQGKIVGLMQGFDLVGDSLESIMVELSHEHLQL